MKCLLIMPSYIPYGGAVANIASRIISNAKEVSFDVLASKMDGDTSCEKGIYYVNDVGLLPFWKAVLKIRNRYDLYCIIQRGLKRFTTPKKQDKLNEQVICAYIRALKKIKKEYDAYMPVVASPSMYEAVRRFIESKKKQGKIIIFQVDPIFGNYKYDPSSSERWFEYEKEMYENSDGVIVHPVQWKTCKICQLYKDKTYQCEWPLIDGNSQSNSDTSYLGKDEEIKEDRITCFFSGYLDLDIRNPEYYFRIIDVLIDKRIKHVIYSPGKKWLIDKLTTERSRLKIEYHDLVPLNVCLKEMEKADFLVNIGNKCVNQMPSKLFDYIRTGKPIINFVKNKNCPTIEYLKKYPMAINLYENKELLNSNAKELCEFLERNLNKRLSYDFIQETYRECTVKTASHAFEQIILEILKKN